MSDGFAAMKRIVDFQLKLQRFSHGTTRLTQELKQPVSILFGFPENNEKFMNQNDYRKLLKIYASTRELMPGRMIHAHMIGSGMDKDVIGVNSLVNFYAKCGEITIARQLFDKMPQRNVVSWSSMMAGYSQNGLAEEALFLFNEMNAGGWRLNHFVFATVLGSCSAVQALEEGKQCHGYILKSGLVFNSYVGNALVSMYSKCSAVEEALKVFQKIPGSDTLPCNALISGFLMHGHDKEALNFLGSMVNDHMNWDYITYVTVLGLCANLKDSKMGLQLHGQILRNHIELNVYVSSAIIDMYGKCGMVLNARRTFNCIWVRNVVSWTAIMAAYAQNKFFEEALNLFPKMGLDGVFPNEFTYAVLLNSCAGISTLKHGYQLHCHIQKSGHRDHLLVGNALINMYSKSGSIEDAHKVFHGMDRRDVVSWNSMISGYAHHGLGIEALQVFRKMQMEAAVPNHVTFVGVLSACAHLGLVDDGFFYLNCLMKELGIKPAIEHYTCMVVLLSRVGLLEKAENFMKSMPVEWDVVAWRSLLSSCHIHGNIGLGKRIAEHILHLDPDDVGTYILLSNIYAKARKWDEVIKIRRLMKGREIKKEPGVSWIQVKNITHVFVSEDKSHPESSKIYGKITELLAEIKVAGYVPEISNVLHDVEDEQKEEHLGYHSEKLAMAFGLLKMPFGAPIHVLKNLRMCMDCHIVAKFVSNVTNRKIIMRDANRFHCFESGVCSCGDYW